MCVHHLLFLESDYFLARGGYLRYEKYIQQHHSKFDAMIQVVSALDNCVGQYIPPRSCL